MVMPLTAVPYEDYLSKQAIIRRQVGGFSEDIFLNNDKGKHLDDFELLQNCKGQKQKQRVICPPSQRVKSAKMRPVSPPGGKQIPKAQHNPLP
jgi:hypothetical protein